LILLIIVINMKQDHLFSNNFYPFTNEKKGLEH